MLAFHVAVSFLAMFASVWCIYAMLRGRLDANALHVFFATHVVTDLTGFPLAPFGMDPARVVGIVSLLVLVVCAAAYYAKQAKGRWLPAFVASFFFASYLNFFVGVTQSFQKVGALQALAPSQTEPPFLIAQLLLLVAFIGLAVATFPQVKGRATLPRA